MEKGIEKIFGRCVELGWDKKGTREQQNATNKIKAKTLTSVQKKVHTFKQCGKSRSVFLCVVR
jgi:hypothetical protein